MTWKDNLNIIIIIIIIIVSLLGKIIDCLLKLPPLMLVNTIWDDYDDDDTMEEDGYGNTLLQLHQLVWIKPPNGAVNWHRIYPNVRGNTCRCGLTLTKTQL